MLQFLLQNLNLHKKFIRSKIFFQDILAVVLQIILEQVIQMITVSSKSSVLDQMKNSQFAAMPNVTTAAYRSNVLILTEPTSIPIVMEAVSARRVLFDSSLEIQLRLVSNSLSVIKNVSHLRLKLPAAIKNATILVIRS